MFNGLLNCDKSSFSHQYSRLINMERIIMAWDTAQAAEQKSSGFHQDFSEQQALCAANYSRISEFQKFSSNVSPVEWQNKLQL